MHRKSTLLVVFTCFSFVNFSEGANILVILPLPSRSHSISFRPLIEEIIKKGHNLTLVSGYRLSDEFHSHYSHIDVGKVFPNLKIVFAETRKRATLGNLILFSQAVQQYSDHVLEMKEVQRIIRSEEKFDLIVTEFFYMDVFFAFGYKFKAPMIALSAQDLLPYYSWITGNPFPSSVVPSLFLPLTENMSFSERIANSAFNLLSVLYYELVDLPRSQKIMEKHFFADQSENIPQIKYILKNVSVTLVNTHYSFGYARPFLPNVIQTAGLHIGKQKPLPIRLRTFMDESVHGVIYVSLGTLLEPNHLKRTGDIFAKVLKNLPQRVLFKWDSKLLSNIPDNFFVQDWIPQVDILRHSNCKLFITHGGLHSLLESLNASVPLIGLPFFSDQRHNLAIVEYYQIGLKLEDESLEEELLPTVKEILQNPKYQRNMERRSRIFNHRLITPLDAAIYWVEQVLQNDDSKHLRSQLSFIAWYEYFLIDIVAALTIITVIVTFTIYVIIQYSFKMCALIKSKIQKNSKSLQRKKND